MENKMLLSQEELSRYARHIVLPDFGLESQVKLKSARVLVIGSGGLGSPLLFYLAAAGVGRIGIVDFDCVDDSNLQRQILFDISDIGSLKTECAKRRLELLNPFIQVVIHNTRLTRDNAMHLFEGYDVIADGTDNFATRYLVNDASVLLGIPNVYASIFQFEGQVSVFNYAHPDGNVGPNYRDLHAEPPPPDLIPNCAVGGVLGVLPGIIGSMQALEVIKVITGTGEPLSGRLFHFDALNFESRIFQIERNPLNPLTGDHPTQRDLINYEAFCTAQAAARSHSIKEISVRELKDWQSKGEDFQLIDVREPYEFDIVNLGAELIPLSSILKHADRIDRAKRVVVHCKMGGRSAQAVKALEDQFGFTNLYNLKGGIIAYVEEIEPALSKY